MGVAQKIGSMEGKEIRFGSAATALWSVVTTSTSNGSVNGMHDSLTPISGGVVMLDMMINALVWRCWRRIAKLFHLYHHCCFYFGIDGGTNTGIHGT